PAFNVPGPPSACRKARTRAPSWVRKPTIPLSRSDGQGPRMALGTGVFALLGSRFSVRVQVQVQVQGSGSRSNREPRTPNPEPRTTNREPNREPEHERRTKNR